MSLQSEWPITAGDHETHTFVFPGTLGAETYDCEVRAHATRGADSSDPLATATVTALQVGDNIEVTAALSAVQTRTIGTATAIAFYDLVQTVGGLPSTLFSGQMPVSPDVTK